MKKCIKSSNVIFNKNNIISFKKLRINIVYNNTGLFERRPIRRLRKELTAIETVAVPDIEKNNPQPLEPARSNQIS